jgi:hypothetical protein
VDQLYGFEDSWDAAISLPDDEEILQRVARAMWEQSSTVRAGRARSLAAAMYVFSDVVDIGFGNQFGKYLQQHPEFGACVGTQAKNPNSGNLITTYIWVPNLEALKESPAWMRGRKAALAAISDREKLGW